MSVIFACESSARAASAAVLRDGALLCEYYADVGLTHSQTLMELCDEAFRRASLDPADADVFAASSGPGSFTGLRIGLGIIKGLAFAALKPCAGVPALEALAYGARPTDRVAVPVLDARRGRVYAARFEMSEGAPRRLSEDGIFELSELADMLAGERVFFIGDAAEICYNKLKNAVDCVCSPPERSLPRASWTALAAARMEAEGRLCTASGLCASYLQPSQAERVRRQREEDAKKTRE